MATFKHISSKNADYGAAEQYLTFEHDEFTMKPTLDENGRLMLREDYRIATLNCGDEDFAVACMRSNLRYGKNQKREDISASLSCRKMQDWKPYSRKYRPLIVNNAASRSQLTENGCTAHSAVPKKLAVSRQQQGCVSIGRNNNRCNAFALGKPWAARLF